MRELTTPIPEEAIRALRAGEEVLVTGRVVTARDAAHKLMVEQRPEELREILAGSVIYHCGPIVRKKGATYSVVAAGPTTSIREEPYQANVIEHYGVRGVIGKGGMGAKTLEACQKFGAAYLHAVGGAAVSLAEAIKCVEQVRYLKEFGVPEAVWVLRVERFPVVVTMDAHGKSLHRDILETSGAVLARLMPQ